MELDDDDDDNDVQSTNIEINLDNKIEKSTNGRLDRMVDSECLKAQALELASTRLFTQEEFETMRKHQQAKQVINCLFYYFLNSFLPKHKILTRMFLVCMLTCFLVDVFD